jgi:hypothetical protein
MCGHSFHPVARKDRVPRGPRFWRNGRVGLSFLVYTISKNALAVIIVRRLAVLDRIGKVFSPLMPAQTLKLCIIYIP